MRVRQFGGAQAPPHDKHWARPNYLFSRLLICGQCGHKFDIVDPGTMDVAAGNIEASRSARRRLKYRARLWSRSCCLPFSVIFSPRKGSCTLSRKSLDCSPNVTQELDKGCSA